MENIYVTKQTPHYNIDAIYVGYTLCILLLSIIVTLLNNSENIALHKYFPIDRLLAAWGVNGMVHNMRTWGIYTILYYAFHKAAAASLRLTTK